MPVLVILGHNDEYGTLAQVRAIEKRVGGPVETMMLEHCGHDPHRDHPDSVLAQTTTFTREILQLGNP